jgi:hypothetical protein
MIRTANHWQMTDKDFHADRCAKSEGISIVARSYDAIVESHESVIFTRLWQA